MSSCSSVFLLQYPFHKAPHLLRRALLHLSGGVCVGAQGEASVIVAQHVGHCFHVHAVLQSNGRECVPKIVEADVEPLKSFCVGKRTTRLYLLIGWDYSLSQVQRYMMLVMPPCALYN